MNKKNDQLAADNIRALAISMVEKANSGHPGGPMGGADYMHILYSEFFNYDPSDMAWPFRDRFFMDAGHLSPLLYAQYYLLGNYSKTDIQSFRQWGSVTPGHPEVDVNRGIENTSGPLGQGHTMGVGAAIAAKFLEARFGDWMNHKIYGFISDGGVQEEISQGAGRIAGHLGLNNFIMFYDSNDVQLSTKTDEVTSEDTAMKYRAWGWKVVTIDGHDHDEIRNALKEANAETEKPTLIIGKTIMGKGCVTADGTIYEGYTELHGKPIGDTGADFVKTLINLGANPEDEFAIYSDVEASYKELIANKIQKAQVRKQEIASWKSGNAALSDKLDMFLSGKLPELDFESIAYKEGLATRAASANVLGYLAGMANGMALHGGVIPVVATFFVFSDYMKPAIRLSAIQELPVKFVWTHDAFRVGEDGPTHQPVEQEAQIRLLEKLKNHSGDASFIALRPADSAETVVGWKMLLENNKVPSGLILSRQGIKDVPALGASRYADALASEKGGYLVKKVDNPDVVLIANGSEVSTLIAAAELLEERKGLKVNIASVISEGLFRNQTKAYQDSVITPGKPVFGLTAGLPVNLEGLAGPGGKVFGLDHFGYSAPATVLDEKFGFTGEKVYQQVVDYLK